MPVPTPARARRLAVRLLAWFRASARDLPWRRTRDPYAIWVSEIMLQQTQVKTVIPYWERWMHELPTVEALAAAPPDRVLELWEGLGYYTRARNLQRAARTILASQDRGHQKTARCLASARRGDTGSGNRVLLPRDFPRLLALPGVGRYTAGAVCSIAFNQPTPVLDGNVTRVLSRLFGLAANVRDRMVSERLWTGSARLVLAAGRLPDPQDNNCSHFNQAMMELGATVCTPRRPRCEACPWRRLCVARRKQCQDALPNRNRPATPTARTFHAFVLEHEGEFLLRRRPPGVVNAGLWEFPNVEAASWKNAARKLGLRFHAIEPLCEVRHSITRYRIRLQAWRAKLTERRRGTGDPELWLKPAEAARRALPSAHRKVLNRLLSTD